VGSSRLLVLPLSLLLFLQWPLREWVQAYSREANDLGQILFAVYVAIAVTEATRRGAHLAADAFAHRYGARTRALLERVAALLVLAPFGLLVLYHGAGPAWRSVLQLERFQETLNPGYFLIRLAVLLLALLVLVQAARDLVKPLPDA
jgi:TRAP-type C4-dicarboxylate transport system permease small subunit